MHNYIPKKYLITAKTEVAPSTFLFRLKGKLDFQPGQFVEISSDHFGEATFAPCSSPSNEKYFEVCIRNCGSTSHHLADLMPSDEMSVRGPYGNGWPTNKLKGKDIIMIAGGLGLVPLRPLILSMLEKKNRNMTIVAGFRSSEHLLFEQDLKCWSKIFKVNAMAEVATTHFWGQKGMITDGIDKLKLNHKKTIVLICGPEMMVPFCIEELAKKGITDSQIYISYERRMECGIGVCQHCSIGKYLVCADGPVFAYDKIKGEVGK